MHTKTTRGLLALVTAVGCLLMTAMPASADPVGGAIAGGSIVITKTGQTTQTVPLGDGDGVCPDGALTVDLSSTAANVTAFSATERFEFPTGSGTFYVAVINRLSSTAGAVSGSSPATVTNMRVVLDLDISTVGGSGCTPVTKVCDAAAGISLTGTYSGNPASEAVGDSFLVDGSNYTTVVANPTCSTPFASYLGSAITIDDLAVEVTSV